MLFETLKRMLFASKEQIVEASARDETEDTNSNIQPPSKVDWSQWEAAAWSGHPIVSAENIESVHTQTNEIHSYSTELTRSVSEREAALESALQGALATIKRLEESPEKKATVYAATHEMLESAQNEGGTPRSSLAESINHKSDNASLGPFSPQTSATIKRLEASLVEKEARLKKLLDQNGFAAAEINRLRNESERQAKELSNVISTHRLSIDVLRNERDEAVKKSRDASAKTDELETRFSDLSLLVAEIKADLDKVRVEKEKANEGWRNANQRAQTLEVEIGKRSKEIKFWTGQFFAHCPHVSEWLAQIEDCGQEIDWPQEIVTVGCDPMGEDAFDSLLRRHGYVPYPPGNGDAEVMIVGRGEWSELDLQNQIASRGKDRVRIYSQEMAMIAILTGNDPFDADQSILVEMGSGHPALEFLMNDVFKWPFIRFINAVNASALTSEIELRETSPLTHCEYRVGITSPLTKSERHRILELIFTSDEVFPPHYSEIDRRAWGQSRSKKRLKKIAEHIAHNISFHSARLGAHGPAIREWQEDLDWLRKTFYRKEMGFAWPSSGKF